MTVTRKGQTTIPKEFRDKYDLSEGTELEVIDMGEGIMFKKALSIMDLVGSSKRTYESMKRRLDEIRQEDA